MTPPDTSLKAVAAACPFCGGEPEDEIDSSPAMFAPVTLWRVGCNECSAYGPFAESEALAIEAWNRRVALADALDAQAVTPEPVAWRVVDRIGLGPTLEERWLDKTPAEVAALLNAKEPVDAPYTVTPLYAAPLPATPSDDHAATEVERLRRVVAYVARKIEQPDQLPKVRKALHREMVHIASPYAEESSTAPELPATPWGCSKCENGMVERPVEGSESKTECDFCSCPAGQAKKADTNDALEAKGEERGR